MEKARRRPSPATAIAIVALVIALTGTAGAAIDSSAPRAPLTYTNLTLVNGWQAYGSGTRTPSAAIGSDGIVHLRGAMYQDPAGTELAMTLPLKFRPSGLIYVPVDMCNATNGRLYIYKTGKTYVEGEFGDADSQCFTSLEGVSFAKN